MSSHPALDEAADLVRRAAKKGLGSRTRLRLLSITLWASFLGAIPTLLMLVAVLPAEVLPVLSLNRLSAFFFAAWLCALVPASLGVLLTHPKSWPALHREPPHGH